MSLTTSPSSVQPETLAAVIAPQITLPEESVVRALAPEQVCTVETLKPPYATSNPLKVFVALLVCSMLPPLMVRPDADDNPPADDTLIPPANVDVAVEDALIDPPILRSRPTWRRFANVEEALAIMFCVRRVEEAWRGRLETKSP